MRNKPINSVFWALVGIFVVAISMTFVRIPIAFFIASGVMVLLGAVLIFLTLRTKVRGVLKVFLLLTGSSACGLFVFGVLHNVVSYLLDTEEPVFFMLAILVCPIGFLVGVVGTIVINIRSKQEPETN